MSNSELNYLDKLIEEMRERENEVKAISEEIDALKNLIRDEMLNRELSEINTANHKIIYSDCQRTTVNKKTLQTEYPDIFSKVVKISSYKMLRIS